MTEAEPIPTSTETGLSPLEEARVYYAEQRRVLRVFRFMIGSMAGVVLSLGAVSAVQDELPEAVMLMGSAGAVTAVGEVVGATPQRRRIAEALAEIEALEAPAGQV